MEISNIILTDFLSHADFNFENLSSFKFGEVYIIYSINEPGAKEKVKIKLRTKGH